MAFRFVGVGGIKYMMESPGGIMRPCKLEEDLLRLSSPYPAHLFNNVNP